MWPVPPGQSDQSFRDFRWLTKAQWFSRSTSDNGIGFYVLGHNSARRDDSAVTQCDLWFHHDTYTDPRVMADGGGVGRAVSKECFVAPSIMPIVVRTILKVMQRSGVQGVVCCADARKGCDIGKFANLGIRDVSVTVAIAVVAKNRIVNVRAFADLDKCANATVCNYAIRMNKGCVCREFGHSFVVQH